MAGKRKTQSSDNATTDSSKRRPRNKNNPENSVDAKPAEGKSETPIEEPEKEVLDTATGIKKPEPVAERIITVYGNKLWIEEDPAVTNEQIRQKIVDEYFFPEFTKEQTHWNFNKETGVLTPSISFQKKG